MKDRSEGGIMRKLSGVERLCGIKDGLEEALEDLYSTSRRNVWVTVRDDPWRRV